MSDTLSDLLSRVPVSLGDRAYEVVIGEHLVADAGRWVGPLLGRRRRVLAVTDETVAGHHLPAFSEGLAAAGIETLSVIVPPGEGSKSWAGLQALVDRLLALGLDRGTLVAALGGGVVGDLAGFAAAIAMRGVEFVQIPTTLLAQVDSSVGGKTGINTAAGKNMVGAFHQPRLVLADIGVLDTLPAREVRSGYAEVAKHAAIGDAAFFGVLEHEGPKLVAGDRSARRRAVEHSVRTKARIVAADEREAGQRALLNLGHTFGHALEAETGFGQGLLHGEAVALGMVLAFGFSARLGLAPAEDGRRLAAHLDAVGLPTRLDQVPGAPFDAARLVEHMAHDKKVKAGALTFILARGLGDCFVADDVPADQVLDFLTAVS